MGVLFRLALRRSLGQILAWGLGMALLAASVVPLYAPFLEQQRLIEQMLKDLPPAWVEMLGGVDYMFTPEGYLTVQIYAVLPLLLGIHAVLAGSGLLAVDEEAGRLDLILAHPVRRRVLYVARLLAWLVTLGAILLATWLALVLPMALAPIGVSPLAALLPFVSLAGLLVLFGALALLLSQVLPSRRLAATVAGVALLASYVLASLSGLGPFFRYLAWLSPLTWYQSGGALRGLRLDWLLVLLAPALVLLLLAAWRFERRDVRLAGEGGWARAPRAP